MSNYVVYQVDTGQILKTVTCGDDLIHMQCGDGEAYTLDTGCSDLTHKVGATGCIEPLPAKPSPYHVFDYQLGSWILDPIAGWRDVRAIRDRRIAACDWVVTAAMEAGTEVTAAWKSYRQALRDVTQQSDPSSVVWPIPPN